MDLMSLVVGLVVGLVLGIVVIAAIFFKKYRQSVTDSEKSQLELEQLKRSLETEKKAIRISAEKEAEQKLADRREAAEKEVRETRAELKSTEKRLAKREDALENKEQEIREREKSLIKKEVKLDSLIADNQTKERELSEKIAQQDTELLKISGMSKQEAQQRVLTRVEEELGAEIGELVEKATEKAQGEIEDKTREMMITAIERYSGEQVSEVLVSAVDLPNDDMKGRIIGREGRNIRTFEKVTGTDVVVDDTPGVVVVSAFDPVRRQIAKRALDNLISDGRIHPARIEEIVSKTRNDTMQEISRAGREAFNELNLPKPHPKIAMLVGRLKFRYSYGQNVLQHSKEVANLMGMVAAELGLDQSLARRCGLLHDIGKAVDHESEGTHSELGMELAKRCNERPEVLNAIGSHHEKIAADNVYSILVKVMDSVSAARPGARSETLEKYLKRLEKLESIATDAPGVEQAFAIQAGREIRVLINANAISDKEVYKICRDISKRVEKELTYPGEIKVTCIRETRVVEVAR
ncbi:MAG: ribonuclease Y [Planctomycetota bacterium]|nr:ribonuclease Y [Planctomycetota bacterium]